MNHELSRLTPAHISKPQAGHTSHPTACYCSARPIICKPVQHHLHKALEHRAAAEVQLPYIQMLPDTSQLLTEGTRMQRLT